MLVVVTDSYDLVMSGPPEELVKKWRGLLKLQGSTPKSLVVGAEGRVGPASSSLRPDAGPRPLARSPARPPCPLARSPTTALPRKRPQPTGPSTARERCR